MGCGEPLLGALGKHLANPVRRISRIKGSSVPVESQRKPITVKGVTAI